MIETPVSAGEETPMLAKSSRAPPEFDEFSENLDLGQIQTNLKVKSPPGLIMPTMPWCVGPMLGVVGVSSQIPQAPPDSNPNEIEIQDSAAGSSGCLIC